MRRYIFPLLAILSLSGCSVLERVDLALDELDMTNKQLARTNEQIATISQQMTETHALLPRVESSGRRIQPPGSNQHWKRREIQCQNGYVE